MNTDEYIQQVERYLGYPVRDPDILGNLRDSVLGRTDISEDEVLDWFEICADVQGAFFADRESQVPMAERRQALAWHLVGLFAYRTIPPGEVTKGATGKDSVDDGLALADMNERRDRLSCPVYYSGPATGTIREYLFASTTEADDFARRVFHMGDPARDDRDLAIAELVEDYPHACSHLKPWIERKCRGTLPLDSVEPRQDEDGVRLFAAYEAALPIADVLLQRGEGKQATLTPAAHRAALDAATNDQYAPHLLLRMLAEALSAKSSDGVAREVLNGRLGVLLTRRWAAMIVEGYGPFAQDPSRTFGFLGVEEKADGELQRAIKQAMKAKIKAHQLMIKSRKPVDKARRPPNWKQIVASRGQASGTTPPATGKRQGASPPASKSRSQSTTAGTARKKSAKTRPTVAKKSPVRKKVTGKQATASKKKVKKRTTKGAKPLGRNAASTKKKASGKIATKKKRTAAINKSTSGRNAATKKKASKPSSRKR